MSRQVYRLARNCCWWRWRSSRRTRRWGRDRGWLILRGWGNERTRLGAPQAGAVGFGVQVYRSHPSGPSTWCDMLDFNNPANDPLLLNLKKIATSGKQEQDRHARRMTLSFSRAAGQECRGWEDLP
jgi:hypothetical protein